MQEDKFENVGHDDPYAINDEASPATENATQASSAAEQSEESSSNDVKSPNETEDSNTSESPLSEEASEETADSPKNDEEKTIGSDIIRGHINTIILRSLYERDKYGYEIMDDIQAKSHGQYSLKQPTLYSALKRLENQGYIKAYWKTDEVSAGGRRKYFTLTDSGKDITEQNLIEWAYSRTIIDSLITDKSFDFSQPAPSPVDFHILKNSVSRVPIVRSDEADRALQTGEGTPTTEQRQTENAEQSQRIAEPSTQSQDATPQLTDQPQAQNKDNSSTVIQQQQDTNQNLQQAPTASVTQQQIEHDVQQVNESVVDTTTQTQPKSDTQPTTQQQSELTPEQLQAAQQALIAQQQQTIEAQQQAIAAQQYILESQQQPAVPQEPQLTAEEQKLAAEQAAQEEARRLAHENYLRLISEPVREPEPIREDIVPNSDNVNTERLIYNNRPETERDYKNLIDGIFNRAVANGSVQTTYSRATPKSPEHQSRVRLIDRGRADGVSVAASSTHDTETYAVKTTFNKGLTLLKCSAIVLAICAIEFILCFLFLNQLNTSWIYPAAILLLGLIQFVVFGIMAIKGYGKNCVIPTTNSYISSCLIITFISILIISAMAFLLNVNPNSISDVMKMIVIPSITALNITVFAVSYKLFLK